MSGARSSRSAPADVPAEARARPNRPARCEPWRASPHRALVVWLEAGTQEGRTQEGRAEQGGGPETRNTEAEPPEIRHPEIRQPANQAQPRRRRHPGRIGLSPPRRPRRCRVCRSRSTTGWQRSTLPRQAFGQTRRASAGRCRCLPPATAHRDYRVDEYGFDPELTERFVLAALRPIAVEAVPRRGAGNRATSPTTGACWRSPTTPGRFRWMPP